MAQAYNEDDLYRASTQYKLWSFSPDELATLRANTNTAALERAKTYLPPTELAQCLSAAEEVRLIQRYCEQIRSTCDFFKWGVNVKATAVQYLKRFFLTNSAMTYPPKEIYKSVLFLASKTEGVHMTLGEFARRIKSKPEDVLAPEYKIIQSLRFTLDVRQPFRALRGCLMELLNLAEASSPPISPDLEPGQARSALASLPPPSAPDYAPAAALSSWSPGKPLADRANAAYSSARNTLDAPALLTDLYFLFTPPQMYLAALLLADRPLVDFYLRLKLSSSSEALNGHAASFLDRLMGAVEDCARVLAAHGEDPVMSKEEKAGLEKRLEAVRDPLTRDLVGASKAVKEGGDGDQAEKARRRKEEREKAQREGDVFGGGL